CPRNFPLDGTLSMGHPPKFPTQICLMKTRCSLVRCPTKPERPAAGTDFSDLVGHEWPTQSVQGWLERSQKAVPAAGLCANAHEVRPTQAGLCANPVRQYWEIPRQPRRNH